MVLGLAVSRRTIARNGVRRPSGGELYTPELDNLPVTTRIAYTPDGRNAFCVENYVVDNLGVRVRHQRIRRWLGVPFVIEPESGVFLDVLFNHQNGKSIVTADEKGVSLWPVPEGKGRETKPLSTLPLPPGKKQSFTFFPNGKGEIWIDDKQQLCIHERGEVRTMGRDPNDGPLKFAAPLVFTRDGATLAIHAELEWKRKQFICFYDTQTWEKIAMLGAAPNPKQLAFSPDGARVAVTFGADANQAHPIKIWDFQALRQVK